MKEVIAILIIVGGLAVMIIFGLDRLADAESRKVHAQAALAESQGRARATIIEAQAESRLHAAQASAITSAALIPWGILGVLGLLGLAIVALAFVVIARKPQAPPMIERRMCWACGLFQGTVSNDAGSIFALGSPRKSGVRSAAGGVK